MTRTLMAMVALGFLACAAHAGPRQAFAAAQAASRKGDHARAAKALRATWRGLPRAQRRGAAGVRVLVMLGKTHARLGAPLAAAVHLGRALHALEAQAPVDRDRLGATRRLLRKIAMAADEPVGPALLARAEAARPGPTRLAQALAAEALLRDHAEFGDAAELCQLARTLALFPAGDRRAEEASKIMLEAAATGDLVALELLADWYRTGTAVPKDPAMAHRYYNLAALEGSDAAAAKRDELAASTTPPITTD